MTDNLAPAAPTPVGAPGWLAEVRKRSDWALDRYAEAGTVRESAADVPALVAALEAVLALAAEWDQRSAALAGEQPLAAEYQTCRAQTLSECANRAKVAIETALRDTQGGAGPA